MPLLALGHKMALSLLTLVLGSALTAKPRATKRDATATTMIRGLGFGLGRDAKPRPVGSAAVKLIKRGPESRYSILKSRFSGVSDAIDEALVALGHSGTAATSHCQQTTRALDCPPTSFW